MFVRGELSGSTNFRAAIEKSKVLVYKTHMHEEMTGILRFPFSAAAACVPRAVFLDRDGTINTRVCGECVTGWAGFRFMPGAIASLSALAPLPDRIIVISNQQSIGKGLMSVDELKDLTVRFVEEARREGARIDDVYYCPHLLEQGCACRKPRPGLLQRAAADWGLDLGCCCMIGDSLSDVLAAEAAGCAAILIGQESAGDRDAAARRWPLARDLGEAVQLILKARAAPGRLAASAAAAE